MSIAKNECVCSIISLVENASWHTTISETMNKIKS